MGVVPRWMESPPKVNIFRVYLSIFVTIKILFGVLHQVSTPSLRPGEKQDRLKCLIGMEP